MRIAVDEETGEVYEIVDNSELVGDEPYAYGQFRRAQMASSRQQREAITAYSQAGINLARAERDYHRELAIAVGRLKAQHGATVAETLAKGDEKVSDAKDARDACVALERAAMERIRLCRDDRSALLVMGAWSRQANADGWE